MKYLLIYRILPAAVVGLLFIFGWQWVGESEAFGREASFVAVSGVAFGILLQRSRFCFFCILRDFFEFKDGRPLAGLVTALIIGSIGYLVLFGAWVSDPMGGYLPQDAHIGPVSWHLLLGGLLFGWGMALSGACISAHFYRLGEGSAVAPFALFGTIAGFILGYLSWNMLYVDTISTAPVLWLPEMAGYSRTVVLQTALLLALIIWLLVSYSSPKANDDQHEEQGELNFRKLGRLVFEKRWPTWVGGVGIGILAVFYYFRNEPLGVTAELGRVSRNTGEAIGIMPDRLQGLDGLAGSTITSSSGILSVNGIFVVALILGSLFTSLMAGQFRPKRVSGQKIVKGLGGGVLLGFGAMIALGCTIGTTLSGIMAFALSGWVFTIAMVAGVWSGIALDWHR